MPIPDDISGLSAILLNDAYYDFLLQGRRIVDGLSVLDEKYLIPFKVKAWCELTAHREKGEEGYSRHIRKHYQHGSSNYEKILRPSFEYLESHSPCTVNDMYEHNPYKEEIYVQQVVSCFRLDSVKPFCKREVAGGGAYFYLVLPENYQSKNPEDWELEARKLRQGN